MTLGGKSFSLRQLLVNLVVIAACIGLLLLAISVFGIPVPPWFWQAIFIVLAAIFFIFCINAVCSINTGDGGP
jgi:hypothetical protein